MEEQEGEEEVAEAGKGESEPVGVLRACVLCVLCVLYVGGLFSVT